MSDVTRILSQIEQGDPQAAEKLLPLVYDELRKLAAAKLAQEKPGQTLQATALVHEAYLRLVGANDVERWDGRGHFFAAAAEAMRRILIENARRKHGPEAGGKHRRVELSSGIAATGGPDIDLLAMSECLDKLQQHDARAAELVKLRYFGGLTIKEAAEVLGMSPRAADLLWAFARAWLLRKIEGNEPGTDGTVRATYEKT